MNLKGFLKNRKRKKTLVQRQQEIFVETNKLTLYGLRCRAEMLHAAMQLETKREPKRYVA